MIRNTLNYEHKEVKGEKFTMPSETIPDQTLSISQIMERYARGLPLEGERVPLYTGEEQDFIPDLRSMDISEIEDWKKSNQKEIDRIKATLSKSGKKVVQEGYSHEAESTKNP